MTRPRPAFSPPLPEPGPDMWRGSSLGTSRQLSQLTNTLSGTFLDYIHFYPPMQYLTSLSILIYLEEYPIEVLRDKIGTDQDNLVPLTFHSDYYLLSMAPCAGVVSNARAGRAVVLSLSLFIKQTSVPHLPTPSCRRPRNLLTSELGKLIPR